MRLRDLSARGEILQYYGRRRLLRFADSFRDLSEVYMRNASEGMGTETEEEEKEKSGKDEKSREDRREILNRYQLYHNEARMSDRLNQIADSISMIANENVLYRRPPRGKVRTLNGILKSHGIIMREVFFIEKETGREIALTMKGSRDSDLTTDEIGEILCDLFEMPLASARDNLYFVGYDYDTYLYESLPPFCLETGYAKAAKETEKISGDSYIFYEHSESDRYIILSDGAGSGEQAREDSGRVLDWIIRYLEAGFGLYEAASMVNSVFVSGCREINMPTLDACHINLQDGRGEFVKFGAVSTYIRRRNGLETVKNSDFPLGFHSTTGDRREDYTYDFSGGEVCVMISDGVLECYPSEKDFKILLSKASINEPKSLAAAIMQYSIGMSQGRIRDDMTILVFRVKPA